MTQHVRSIFISDTHFGFRHNRSDLLVSFLTQYSCDNLYLVGDIVDLWEIQRKFRWTIHDTLAVRQILMKMHTSKVYYIVGNHDGDLRAFIKRLDVDRLHICNEIEHVDAKGRRWLVVHGDIFDNTSAAWTFLSKIGSRAYEWSIIISKWINRMRSWMGKEPWSLALYLKRKVKKASAYMSLYERHMAQYCADGEYDGVICGHIHEAKISQIHLEDPFMDDGEMISYDYVNCGDWVESCTAVIENYDGTFEIVDWKK